MKGVKTTVSSEKGDIVRSNGEVSIYEISGTKALEYSQASSGDKLGFYTGQKKTFEGYTYTEIVLFNSLNDDLSPDFEGDKYYFLEGMPVSFLPNANYDYTGVSTTPPKKNNDILGTISGIFNTVLGFVGLFSKKKTASQTDTKESDTEVKNVASDKEEEESFVAKYGIYLFSGLTIVIVGTVIYLVNKNSQKKKIEAAVVPPRQ